MSLSHDSLRDVPINSGIEIQINLLPEGSIEFCNGEALLGGLPGHALLTLCSTCNFVYVLARLITNCLSCYCHCMYGK